MKAVKSHLVKVRLICTNNPKSRNEQGWVQVEVVAITELVGLRVVCGYNYSQMLT